jgi:hypothetical protein
MMIRGAQSSHLGVVRHVFTASLMSNPRRCSLGPGRRHQRQQALIDGRCHRTMNLQYAIVSLGRSILHVMLVQARPKPCLKSEHSGWSCCSCRISLFGLVWTSHGSRNKTACTVVLQMYLGLKATSRTMLEMRVFDRWSNRRLACHTFVLVLACCMLILYQLHTSHRIPPSRVGTSPLARSRRQPQGGNDTVAPSNTLIGCFPNQAQRSSTSWSHLDTHTSMPTYLAFPLPFLFASSCGHCTKHLSTTLLSIVPLRLIFFTLAQDST